MAAACTQARKEERFLDGAAGTSASSVTASSDDGSSCGGASASSHGNSYAHYSYLCAPPNGVSVDLKNGIELERIVSVRWVLGQRGLRHFAMGPALEGLSSFRDRCYLWLWASALEVTRPARAPGVSQGSLLGPPLIPCPGPWLNAL